MIKLHKIQKFYWAVSNYCVLVKNTFQKKNRFFGTEVLKSYFYRYLEIKPKHKSTQICAEKAANWLLRAQDATPDNGVSNGYFMSGHKMEWRPSYPETTGYIIQSLIEYGRLRNNRQIIHRALAMAEWEAQIQMPSGAVQGGMICPPRDQKAAVFNTGMVLQGLTEAFRETGNEKFLKTGQKAADFLVGDMNDKGHYQTHGGYVVKDEVKTYNILCSWALYRFGEDSGNDIYKAAAVKNGKATLEMQLPNGWFANCCLTKPDKPLTHTIGYTLQGLLELGVLSGHDEFIASAELGIKPFVQHIKPNGYLAGRFDRNWNPKAGYSCLTGSAQIAIVLYRLAQVCHKPEYAIIADRLVDFLKTLQLHDCPNPNMTGATSGSFPLFGGYMTAGYPNWATKYFLDAVLLQERHQEL